MTLIMNEEKNEFIPTRRSLLTRLKNWEDHEGWQTFFDTYWKLIYRVATRAGLPDNEAQDVVQDTFVSVARQIPTFRYDPSLGSFKGWLCQITRRRIADHFRKKHRQVPVQFTVPGDTATTPLATGVADPATPHLESLWEQEWKQHLLETAWQRVKSRVDPKHLQVYDCYVRKEWPVEEVAAALGVSAGSVYLIKHRLSAMLKKEMQRLESTD